MADAPAPASDADPSASAPQPEIRDAAEPTASSPSPAEAEASAVEEQGADITAAPVVAAPDPEPTPEPSLPEADPALSAPVPTASVSVNGVPEVAAILEVPASAPGGGDSGDGGEWDLLLQKLRHWLGSGQLQQQWQSARGPLSLVAGLLALLLVLRVYGALLAVVDSLPLVPGLLELVGVIAVTRFGLTRLVRSSDRQAVLGDLQQRWQAFRGKA
jgi:CAAD domains of cyanobacterial aminoacyl-tRNA synthetase